MTEWSYPQLLDTERVPKLCFCRNQAVLGTNNCCQELSAALPSPCTTHDSQHSLFSLSRQNAASTRKESPAGCWFCCFRRRKPSSGTKRHLQHNAREPSETEVIVLAGEPSPCQPTRSRASSIDALRASISGELLGSTNHCSSNSSLPSNISDGEKELIHVHVLISPGSAEDADLSLPDTAVTSLDCDPVPLQCSPYQTEAECSDSSTSVQEQVSISEEKQSLLEGDLQSALQS
ncbi:rho GTPase-activating protein 32-like [Meleagris gallopavo]|uniref:rho GTPase-activating protein 32-like n=1 Tax=Meleagris gallopavo TaxID=9103 RepID=UPI00093DC36F|nr:rho GTPase-activating protein 32-like [Meleagris gallopavo]